MKYEVEIKNYELNIIEKMLLVLYSPLIAVLVILGMVLSLGVAVGTTVIVGAIVIVLVILFAPWIPRILKFLKEEEKEEK